MIEGKLSNGIPELVDLLLQKGANPNAVMTVGYTK
jgi:hypothetical protein